MGVYSVWQCMKMPRDKYPLYIWGIRGGYSSGKEADFKLKVSVDVPEIKQGAAGVIGDGSVAFCNSIHGSCRRIA